METIGARLDQAFAFVTLADAGNFTRAAARLSRSSAATCLLSQAFERALGAQLVLRTTRRVALTESGKLYLEYCRQLRDTLGEAERAVSAVNSEVTGTIRLTAPLTIGDVFLADLIVAFQQRYPVVRVDLDLSIVRRDLVAEGYDLAIRSTRTLDDSLVARPLGVLRELAVASPAFVAGRQFDEPASLVGVQAVHNSSFRDDPHWVFERDGRSEPVSLDARLSVNSYSAIRRAALAGAGVVRLPLYMARDALDDGTLVRVCPGWELITTPLYVVYPQRRHQPLRTRVFVEFLLRWFEQPERRALLR